MSNHCATVSEWELRTARSQQKKNWKPIRYYRETYHSVVARTDESLFAKNKIFVFKLVLNLAKKKTKGENKLWRLSFALKFYSFLKYSNSLLWRKENFTKKSVEFENTWFSLKVSKNCDSSSSLGNFRKISTKIEMDGEKSFNMKKWNRKYNINEIFRLDTSRLRWWHGAKNL